MATPSTLLDVLGGKADASQLFSGVYSNVEFRTNLSPPLNVETASALDNSPPNPFVKWLAPTVIFSGPYGRTVVAPFGEAGNGTFGTIAIVAALIAFGFVVGRLSQR